MAQRNMLNPRNTEGPAGRSRKSATSAKPVTSAASSVKIKSGKPETSAERKQAEAERKAKIQKKAEDRQRRAARVKQQQRTAEAKAKLARGEITAEEAKAAMSEQPEVEKPPEKTRWQRFMSYFDNSDNPLMQDSRYAFWVRLRNYCRNAAYILVALAMVGFAIYKQPVLPFLIPAYIAALGYFGVQFFRVSPLAKHIQEESEAMAKASPKQLKHQQQQIAAEEKAAAEQLARARQAEKANKKRSRESGEPEKSKAAKTR